MNPSLPQDIKQFIADIARLTKHYPAVPPEPAAITARNNLAVARKDPLGSYWHQQLEQYEQQLSK